MARSKLIAALALTLGLIRASSAPLDGVWRSEGWASLYQIRGKLLRSFEVTRKTCVEGFSAERMASQTVENGATFGVHRGDLLYLIPGEDENHAGLQHSASLASIPLSRVSGLPPVCTPPTANAIFGNFDVFAETFAENYIAFDLRHVDWDNVVAQQRTKLTTKTTPYDLFETFKDMIAPLTDIHTGIDAPNIKRSFDPPLRSGTDAVVRGGIERFAKVGRRELGSITDRAYIKGPVLSLCRGSWKFGLADDGVGYLRILQFGDYSRRKGFAHDFDALNRALDQILGNPKIRSLVLDLRLSFGGDDRLGLAIASRLTGRKYVAYAIQARSDPGRKDAYTVLQTVQVVPGRSPVFTGPVIELIGPITMSAAETFTQALMGRLPHVTRIGENTQGVFCDSLERHLPNGWTFDLPNAVYRGPDKKAFDVLGIPPDILVPVFAESDVDSGKDPAMAEAIHMLSSQFGAISREQR